MPVKGAGSEKKEIITGQTMKKYKMITRPWVNVTIMLQFGGESMKNSVESARQNDE